MAVIGVCSAPGAPGGSTLALALAGVWPGSRHVVLVEADADGGRLAVRYGLSRKVGLLSLAASRRVDAGELARHVQVLPGGLEAVVCSDSPVQTAAALKSSAGALGSWLAGLDTDVVIDSGRARPDGVVLPMLMSADVVLMTARSSAEQIQPAAVVLRTWRELGIRAGWCVIGDSPYTPDEIEAVSQVPVLSVVAHDRKGAEALTAGGSARSVRRSTLVRSVRRTLSSILEAMPQEITPVGAEL